MSNRVTIDHKTYISMNQEIRDMRVLLIKAKTAIDHARKWRLNADPDFQDAGMYRMVSDEIQKALNLPVPWNKKHAAAFAIHQEAAQRIQRNELPFQSAWRPKT